MVWHRMIEGDAGTTHEALIRQELVYVVSAWLYARYPSSDDPVWGNPEWPLQPSRMPRPGYVESSPVWPALAPDQPPVV